MYIFKLYEKDQPLDAVDARLLQDGMLRIGRDPQADWVIHDPSCEISRWHCEYHVQPDGLILRSLGANGMFDEDTRARLPDECDVAVTLPASVCLGPYRLTVDHAAQAGAGGDENRTLIMQPPLGSSIEVPTEWGDGAGPQERSGGGSLLEAFCEGAGIDASAFSTEDPEDVMRRAGAVYRNMVLGIGDLMGERDRMRADYQLSRTTIGGAGNNPFKWAPTQRLAIDLLLRNDRGFLDGPAALAASFRDIKKHLIATFSGLSASLRAAIDRFDPATIEAASQAKGFAFKSRAATHWETACAHHEDLLRQVERSEDGLLNQAFVAAYDAAAAELEARK
ncbi:type VI secretion system-associated FHA domain protein TagH [Sphingobium bisphenolivorans]|uniref:type VI secretion system-associated FHA domain protein TagH n=1 Tax=Sphingobium bisphenolivorans TaxID=1335760 RepID=UPI00039B292E|nr:type VI secretion system-associated FHA domain protein TagH [Sphingobium bisphenolivorans]